MLSLTLGSALDGGTLGTLDAIASALALWRSAALDAALSTLDAALSAAALSAAALNGAALNALALGAATLGALGSALSAVLHLRWVLRFVWVMLVLEITPQSDS